MALERRDYEIRIGAMQDLIDENEEKIKSHDSDQGLCFCINCQELREFNLISSKHLARIKYEMGEKFNVDSVE